MAAQTEHWFLGLDLSTQSLTAVDAEGNVRAVAEAQAMFMSLDSTWAGPAPQTTFVTAGGAD